MDQGAREELTPRVPVDEGAEQRPQERREAVMSATDQNETNDINTIQAPMPEPTMFGAEPPNPAREAALAAVERALAASERLRKALPPKPLPPAPVLREQDEQERWPRGPLPDHLMRPREAAMPLRRRSERPSLDPVVMQAAPPEAEDDRSTGAVLARTMAAVGVAATAALLVIGVVPLPAGLKADGEAAAMSAWSRLFPSEGGERRAALDVAAAAPPVAPKEAPLVERAVALRTAEPETAPIVPQPVAVERIVAPAMTPAAAPAAAPAPAPRALDREEIAVLQERSEKLIGEGDIASARLMLVRAAEAGDARATLLLGSTYDPGVLKKLGVLGVAADVAEAQAWYAKAVELGSPEASLRLERLAQAVR